MSDYIHISGGEDYERVTHIAGVKTTVCKNRFEIEMAFDKQYALHKTREENP